ncbi:NCS2 family permease [Pseudobacillus badius]|uniref:NCS2 family permease n=1 Tax=Bacillus badius TaxID=1455 RepID=UPI0007B0B8AA|nr:NCS2 family permease [Bacillus badius]KZO01143.1 guanine permease [Bacillus badius]MED0667711.1 NCS2 family permease [Bacillus badius]OCS89322.1 guanine permease [Bacillus badius]OVE51298.1 NCS2 family permease [Bacillus badius]TDW02295.1 AGZA family xanthine/uracil permease-like MFS transporter [Bacillus badius]
MKHFFAFQERGTTYKQETLAGITTFLSMAYILVVNPIILSQSGMDKGAVFTATALSAIIGSLLIGLLANYPIGIAPSMGLNTFFTFSVCVGMGIPWQTALTGVFISGVLFVILSLLKIREMIINVIPQDLKHAIAGGIGFFVAFIGLKNAGIITANEGTFIGIGDLHSPPVLLAIFGFIVTVIMMMRGIGGAIFYGMAIATIAGMLVGLIRVPGEVIGAIPSLEPTFGEVFSHLHSIFTPEMLAVIFTFLFVAFFDTAGALIAIASQAGLVKDNKIPNAGKALLADSASTVIGSVLGTSTTAAMVESSAGIAAGGRTGFTSIVISALFAVALFFSPLLSVITAEVTAPALIIVGSLMATEIKHIRWERVEITIPAFITIIMMPLTSSVASGIALGFILYPIAMIARGQAKEIHPLLYVLFAAFLAYFIYL